MWDVFKRLFGGEHKQKDTLDRQANRVSVRRAGTGRRIRRNDTGRASQRRMLGPVEPMRLIEDARFRAANLSIYGLAKLAGMDQTYLRRLLTGQRRSPSRETLISLGEALMHHDERFKKKDLEKILKSAGLMKLTKNWKPRKPPFNYNPRSRAW